MIADLVASYTLDLNPEVTRDQIETEIRETLELIKGIQRHAFLELPDGLIAFELHLHGQTERPVADKTAERFYKMLVRLDMADVKYHGLEVPDDIQITKGKWQGREAVEEIVKKIDGVWHIRLDYYTRGLSYDDLGISDDHAEMIFVKALQQWPKQSIAREAIRRNRDHWERLAELKALEAPERPRGRTGQFSESLTDHNVEPAKRERVKVEKVTAERLTQSAHGAPSAAEDDSADKEEGLAAETAQATA